MSFNRINIVGNLGSDPELRYTPQGHAVASVNIATNEKRGEEEKTTWFRATLWREKAEAFCKFFKKGDIVFIEGKVSLSEWTDKEGKERTSLEVDVMDWQFCNSKQD